MASVAGIGRVDITVGMTLDAVIGYGSMCPCYRIKSTVVKSRRCPDILGVTSGTISRQLSRFMVRVGGTVVISSVATSTGIGRIGVIAVVASSAIVGDASMGS